MISLEIVLLILAYSLIIIAIFLEIVCYKRHLETPQTIAFTGSLLLLIIAFTASPWLYPSGSTTNIYTQVAMILVGLSTPLNVLEERQHPIRPVWIKAFMVGSGLLLLATISGYFMHTLARFQYIVAGFLGLSVFMSMLLVICTKPRKRMAHREKTDRIFSIIFIILVPFSLMVNYVFENLWAKPLQFGFTLPTVFMLLAGSKIADDLQRLSLINHKIEPKEQYFKNFALTDREQEIALLLTQGKTYNQIAEQLYISMPTVKTHASNIYKKCGVNSRHELTIAMAHYAGLG